MESAGGLGASQPAGGLEVCKVEGCLRDMSLEKIYYRRYSVCEAHLRALELLVDGRIQRFCQQCGKFQDLGEFDGTKRSCRTQLARHSLRRRVKLSQRRMARQQQQGGQAAAAAAGAHGDGNEPPPAAGSEPALLAPFSRTGLHINLQPLAQGAISGVPGLQPFSLGNDGGGDSDSGMDRLDSPLGLAMGQPSGSEAANGARPQHERLLAAAGLHLGPGPLLGRQRRRASELEGQQDGPDAAASRSRAAPRPDPLSAPSSLTAAGTLAAWPRPQPYGSSFCLDLDQPPSNAASRRPQPYGSGPGLPTGRADATVHGGTDLVSIARAASRAAAGATAGAAAAAGDASEAVLIGPEPRGWGQQQRRQQQQQQHPRSADAVLGGAAADAGGGEAMRRQQQLAESAAGGLALGFGLQGQAQAQGQWQALPFESQPSGSSFAWPAGAAQQAPPVSRTRHPHHFFGSGAAATAAAVPAVQLGSKSDHTRLHAHGSMPPPPPPPPQPQQLLQQQLQQALLLRQQQPGGALAQRLAQYSILLTAAGGRRGEGRTIEQDSLLDRELNSLLNELATEAHPPRDGARQHQQQAHPPQELDQQRPPGHDRHHHQQQQQQQHAHHQRQQQQDQAHQHLQPRQQRLRAGSAAALAGGGASAADTGSAAQYGGAGSEAGNGLASGSGGSVDGWTARPSSGSEHRLDSRAAALQLTGSGPSATAADASTAAAGGSSAPQQPALASALARLRSGSGALASASDDYNGCTGADAGNDSIHGGASGSRSSGAPAYDGDPAPHTPGPAGDHALPLRAAEDVDGARTWAGAEARPGSTAGQSAAGATRGTDTTVAGWAAVAAAPPAASGMDWAAGAPADADDASAQRHQRELQLLLLQQLQRQQRGQQMEQELRRYWATRTDVPPSALADALQLQAAQAEQAAAQQSARAPAGGGGGSAAAIAVQGARDAVRQHQQLDQRQQLLLLSQAALLPPLAAAAAPLPYESAAAVSYTSDQLLQRLSIKLYGCTPEDLMPDTCARLQTWLASMTMSMLQLTMRVGCAHIIMDVLVLPPEGGGGEAGTGGNGARCDSPDGAPVMRAAAGAGKGAGEAADAYCGLETPPALAQGGQGESGVGEARSTAAHGGAAASPLRCAPSPAVPQPLPPLLPEVERPFSFGSLGSGTDAGSGSGLVSRFTATPGSSVLLRAGNTDSPEDGGARSGSSRTSGAEENVPALPASASSASGSRLASGDGGSQRVARLLRRLRGVGGGLAPARQAAAGGEGGGGGADADADAAGAGQQQQQQQAGGGGAGGGDGGAGGALAELVRALLGPRFGRLDALEQEVAGRRLLLQLDDQGVQLLGLCEPLGAPERSAEEVHAPTTDDPALDASQPHTTGAATATAAATAAAPALLRVTPVAVVAGAPASLALTVRLPPADTQDHGQPAAADGPPPPTLLHLRYGGASPVALVLPPAAPYVEAAAPTATVAPTATMAGSGERAPEAAASPFSSGHASGHAGQLDEVGAAGQRYDAGAADEAEAGGRAEEAGAAPPGLALRADAGIAAAVCEAEAAIRGIGAFAAAAVGASAEVEAVVWAPALASPGLAFLEASRGDVLGPWLPLLVAPSEAVAEELGAAAERMGHDRLRPYLLDLGRLLMLGSAGACLEQAGWTEDWEAYAQLAELRRAMPDAEATAGRVLRTSIEWRLPECAALAAELFLLVLAGP